MLTPRPQLTEEELFEPAACAAGTRAVEAVLQKDREAALLQAEQGKLTRPEGGAGPLAVPGPPSGERLHP